MTGRFTRRQVIGAGLAGGAALALGACTGSSAGRPNSTGSASAAPGELPPIEGPTIITDRSRFPTSFNESPEFAQLVQAGQLPPVAERIGEDPIVVEPLHEIGTYGGVIRRGFSGQVDWQNANRFCAGPDSFTFWDYKWENVIPNIAREFELSDDNRVLTLQLRKGMKWSDGTPFTADDIIFWREDINLYPGLATGSAYLQVGTQQTEVRKLDDFTVEFVSAEPHPLLPQAMAGWTDLAGLAQNGRFGGGGFAPLHYIQQFHPKYTSEAAANQLAQEAGFDGWSTYIIDRLSWHLNADLPMLSPWVVSRPINNPPWEFTANPYSIWVDVEGNQLPYIGEISMTPAEETEVLNLRAAAGEYDFQARHLSIASMPVLLRNQEKSDYTLHQTPGTSVDLGFRLNLAYDIDPHIGDLLRTTDFRRALSLGIERDQINEAMLLGTGVPTATRPPDDSPYYPGDEWATKWATFDPEQANTMLDDIGLTERDSEGYRVRTDGQGRIRLHTTADNNFVDFVEVAQMVKRNWEEIGIFLEIEQIGGTLLVERVLSNETMFYVSGVGTDDPFLRVGGFLPTETDTHEGAIGIPYAKWFKSSGAEGVEPPESVSQLKEAVDLYNQGRQAPDDERAEIGKELYRMHIDQVWTIALVGFAVGNYGMYLASNKLGNIPARTVSNLHTKSPSNALPMTFYYNEE